MRVLFDQNVPRQMVSHLLHHEVTRSVELGWQTLQNGELLRAAEEAGFGCLVTADRNLAYQQNLGRRTIAVVVLPAGNWPLVKTKLAEVVAAIDLAEPKSFMALAPIYPAKRSKTP